MPLLKTGLLSLLRGGAGTPRPSATQYQTPGSPIPTSTLPAYNKPLAPTGGYPTPSSPIATSTLPALDKPAAPAATSGWTPSWTPSQGGLQPGVTPEYLDQQVRTYLGHLNQGAAPGVLQAAGDKYRQQLLQKFSQPYTPPGTAPGGVAPGAVDRRIEGGGSGATGGAVGVNLPGQDSVLNSGYDPAYESGMLGIQRQQAQLNSDQELATRRQNEQYNQATGDLGTAKDRALQMLQSRMADQGILRSGANVSEQERVGGDFANQQSHLAQANARSLEDVLRNVTGQRNDLLGQQQQLAMQHAQTVADQQMQSAQQAAQLQAQQEFNAAMQALQQRIISAQQPQKSATGHYTPGPLSSGSLTRYLF